MSAVPIGQIAEGRSDNADGNFIRELCVALNHRWISDAVFLIFTAYFDESDTHGPAPNLIMAAFVGSARQWELFGRKIRAMKRTYGFTVFHAKDFKAGAGEFRGWSRPKQESLVNDLAVAIRDGLTGGVTITLPRALYEKGYRAPPVPKGMPLDSQYGLCFRMCLYVLIQELRKIKGSHKLHVVIEAGHKNVKDTVRIFDEVKRDFGLRNQHILGTITIAKKSECAELMIADFHAHMTSISEARKKVGLPGYFEMAEGELPRRGEAGLVQIELLPDTLQNLKVTWEEAKQERIEKWRAERDAKRASSAEPSKEKPC